jgi:hypothetical protein
MGVLLFLVGALGFGVGNSTFIISEIYCFAVAYVAIISVSTSA